MRLFLSIELSEKLLLEIEKIQKKLQELNLLHGTYPTQDHLHITLKFIGKSDEQIVEKIVSTLQTLQFQPFEVCTDSIELIPNPDYIRLIWLSILSSELHQLAKEIDMKLSPYIKIEEREFTGHVTLARVKKVNDKKALDEYIESISLEKNCFYVNEFILKGSTLSSEGPIYTDIQRFSLQ